MWKAVESLVLDVFESGYSLSELHKNNMKELKRKWEGKYRAARRACPPRYLKHMPSKGMLRIKTRGHHSLTLVILGLDCKRILMAESPVYWQKTSAHLSFPLSTEDFKKDLLVWHKVAAKLQIPTKLYKQTPELTDEYTF